VKVDKSSDRSFHAVSLTLLSDTVNEMSRQRDAVVSAVGTTVPLETSRRTSAEDVVNGFVVTSTVRQQSSAAGCCDSVGDAS
jgi:hypothetical protein